MQSSKEQQGEITKPSQENNAKKQRKTTEWERLDLFKKSGDIKGTFHARMGTIRDRNSKELKEAEEIKKRQKKYTEELYKKDFNDPDNHNGVVTHLEPEILECEVK